MSNPRCTRSVQESEQRLVARMAQGDIAALEQLYAIYKARICRFLARMGSPESELDAICNEVMLVAWNKAATYEPTSSRVSTWLFGIARFKALKSMEQARRRDFPNGMDFDLLESPQALESGLSNEQWLQVAMASLPDDQRMVVELTFFEGLSYKEIALVVDCPENTVKTRMFHARRKLRQLLEHHGSPLNVLDREITDE